MMRRKEDFLPSNTLPFTSQLGETEAQKGEMTYHKSYALGK